MNEMNKTKRKYKRATIRKWCTYRHEDWMVVGWKNQLFPIVSFLEMVYS